MEEAIRINLLKIADLQIESRQSVEKYRGNAEKDVITIGAELDVAYIVEGSVQKIEDDIQVTVQLIDAKTGNHIWGETYDGDYTIKLLEFQRNIAKEIASSLNVVLTPEEEQGIEKLQTTDIRAYDFYIRGLHEHDRYWQNRDVRYLDEALTLLNKALEIDSKYERALWVKGSSFIGQENYDSAFSCSTKLLDIDPKSPYGHQLRGAYFRRNNEPDLAIENYQIAIKNFKGDIDLAKTIEFHMGTVYCWHKNDYQKGLIHLQNGYDFEGEFGGSQAFMLGNTFFEIGDYEKADKYYSIAANLYAGCITTYRYSWSLIVQSKFKEALNFLDTTCVQQSCLETCSSLRYYTYLTMKDYDKAEEYYHQYLNIGGTPSVYDSTFLAYIYKEQGKVQEVNAILKGARESIENQLSQKKSWSRILPLSMIHGILNEKEESLKYLSEVVDLGLQMGWQDYLEICPIYENLHNDPKFQAIVKRAQDEKAAIRAQVQEMIESGEIDL